MVISQNIKLCYIDTDSFIVHIRIENIYKLYFRRRRKKIRHLKL